MIIHWTLNVTCFVFFLLVLSTHSAVVSLDVGVVGSHVARRQPPQGTILQRPCTNQTCANNGTSTTLRLSQRPSLPETSHPSTPPNLWTWPSGINSSAYGNWSDVSNIYKSGLDSPTFSDEYQGLVNKWDVRINITVRPVRYPLAYFTEYHGWSSKIPTYSQARNGRLIIGPRDTSLQWDVIYLLSGRIVEQFWDENKDDETMGREKDFENLRIVCVRDFAMRLDHKGGLRSILNDVKWNGRGLDRRMAFLYLYMLVNGRRPVTSKEPLYTVLQKLLDEVKMTRDEALALQYLFNKYRNLYQMTRERIIKWMHDRYGKSPHMANVFGIYTRELYDGAYTMLDIAMRSFLSKYFFNEIDFPNHSEASGDGGQGRTDDGDDDGDRHQD